MSKPKSTETRLGIVHYQLTTSYLHVHTHVSINIYNYLLPSNECMCVCVCVCLEKMRQLVFTRSSGHQLNEQAAVRGTDIQLNDRPLSVRR